MCLAFAAALRAFGVPGEVLTDNGKQFTDRFGKGGEVLFDRICRDNGIVHRLTQPRSPTTTGKIERFHGSLRRELLDDAVPFADLAAAQAAVDAWVHEYNTVRPHQAIGMAVPADRFSTARAQAEQELLPLRLPAVLALAPVPPAPADEPEPEPASAAPDSPPGPYHGGPVEFARPVPPSGNMEVLGKQFWLGTGRAGTMVTFWASTEVIHLSIAGARVKSVRSHLSAADLARLAAAAAARGTAAHPRRRTRRSDRGRPGGQQGRSRQPGRPVLHRGGDPRRDPGLDPDRAGHPDVLRPRHPGPAPHLAQPADLGPGPAAARRPPGRAAAPPLGRAGHRPAGGQQHRRDHGRRAEDRPGPASTPGGSSPSTSPPIRSPSTSARTPAPSGGPPPSRSAASKPSSTARLPMFPRQSGKHVLGLIRQESGGTRQSGKRDTM